MATPNFMRQFLVIPGSSYQDRARGDTFQPTDRLTYLWEGVLGEQPALSIDHEIGRDAEVGEITPTGLTAHFIERIEKLNGSLNAFNLVTADRAMAEAQSAEALLASGRDLGPLHGIPYGVKDLYDVVGMPTTAGSQTLEPDLKTEESEAVPSSCGGRYDCPR